MIGRDLLRRLTSNRTRRNLAFKLVSARQPTARWRSLPNALIIGAQRCGTSSLFKYLGAHPQCRPSIRKEVRYFTEFSYRGIDWYRAHFPLTLVNGRRPLVYFEATPDYLLDPRAAGRAVDLLPDLKVIVLLRDPVDRAYSHYWHNRRLGTESLSFREALEREESRIGPALRLVESEPEVPAPKSLLRYSYVERGRYATQLRRWSNLLDKNRMLILRSERVFYDTDATFQEILRFLGLEEWRPDAYRNYSYDSSRPVPPPMPADCRDFLAQAFAEELKDMPLVLGDTKFVFDDWYGASL